MQLMRRVEWNFRQFIIDRDQSHNRIDYTEILLQFSVRTWIDGDVANKVLRRSRGTLLRKVQKSTQKEALRAQAMPRHYALKVLEETHQHWQSLHLVKKKHTIGESSHQLQGRKPDTVSALSVSSVASPKLSVGSASPKLAAFPSPKVGSMKPASVQGQGGVAELTGMEQPLDKLMSGK